MWAHTSAPLVCWGLTDSGFRFFQGSGCHCGGRRTLPRRRTRQLVCLVLRLNHSVEARQTNIKLPRKSDPMYIMQPVPANAMFRQGDLIVIGECPVTHHHSTWQQDAESLAVAECSLSISGSTLATAAYLVGLPYALSLCCCSFLALLMVHAALTLWFGLLCCVLLCCLR